MVGEGVAQLRTLPVGRYVLEASVPADAAHDTPASGRIVGISAAAERAAARCRQHLSRTRGRPRAPVMPTSAKFCPACIASLLACALLLLAAADAPPQLDRLQRADGAQVVPDRFLRAWDPVTVFFASDTGPAAGRAGGPRRSGWSPRSRPSPGAWTWLDARTLQFRPAEAWTPLRRETVTLNGRTARLVPLLPTPVSTGPADDPAGIADLDTFALTFATPVDRAALARLLTIELRPLPGIAAQPAQALTAAGFRHPGRRPHAGRATSRPIWWCCTTRSRMAAWRFCACGCPTSPGSTTRSSNCGCAAPPRSP